MSKYLVIMSLMLIICNNLFSAETIISNYQAAGQVKNIFLKKSGKMILFLDNGIISTNDDCKSFSKIDQQGKGSPYFTTEKYLFSLTFSNYVYLFDLESEMWTDSIYFPNNQELSSVIQKNEKEFLLGVWNDQNDIFYLYNYNDENKKTEVLFTSDGLISHKRSNMISYRNFQYNENAFYKFTDSNIFQMDYFTKKVTSIYSNSIGGISYGFLYNGYQLYFIEKNIKNSSYYNFLKMLDLKSKQITNIDTLPYSSIGITFKNLGPFLHYHNFDQYKLYDLQNNRIIHCGDFGDVGKLLKNNEGNYISSPDFTKYDKDMKVISTNLYKKYQEQIPSFYKTDFILVNNIRNNEIIFYTNDGRVLQTFDERFLYKDITNQLKLNSKVVRIINDKNHNTYLFGSNGEINYSKDDGKSWNYFKMWNDDNYVNGVELDSSGKFLILSGNGLYYFDAELKILSSDNSFKSVNITLLSQTSEYYILVTSDGIYKYFKNNNVTELITDSKNIEYENIKVLLVDKNGNIYLFHKNKGIDKITKNTNQINPFNYGLSISQFNNAGIYQDSIIILNADKNIYVNKIGSINWENLYFKNYSIVTRVLQITQNNEFLINIFFSMKDSIKFEKSENSFYKQIETNLEKSVFNEPNILLFKLSKDNEIITMLTSNGKFFKLVAKTGEIIESRFLMTENPNDYYITGGDIQSNDSILVFCQQAKGGPDTVDIYYYDIFNRQYLDSFNLVHNVEDEGLTGLQFHFMNGDSLFILSKQIIVVNSSSGASFKGETYLYRYKNFEFIKNIKDQFVYNFSQDQYNSNFLCYGVRTVYYKGYRTDYDNLFLIKENNETFDIIKNSKNWGDFSNALIEGYAVSNDASNFLYHRNSDYLELYVLNMSDYTLNRKVKSGLYDRIPLNIASKNGQYYYFANSDYLKILDANTFDELDLIKFNNSDSRNNVSILEDVESNIIYILSEGFIFKLSSLEPGKIKADFEYLPSDVKVGEIVNFKCKSKGKPDKFYWYLNNKLFSIEKDFSYVFDIAGSIEIKLIVSNDFQKDSIIKKIDIINSSVKKNLNKVDFIISPNPATDFITINLQPSEGFEPSEGSVLEIYDMLGVKVISEPIHPMSSSHRMNIENLPAGLYFVKIGDRVEKFVKW